MLSFPATMQVMILSVNRCSLRPLDDFSVLTELHELGRSRAFLIFVADHDTGQTTHHIQEFKV